VKLGGVIHDGETVERVVSDGDIVTLTTSKSTYNARNVVLAAGPWTSQLTEPLGLRLPLEVYALLVASLGLVSPGATTDGVTHIFEGVTRGGPSPLVTLPCALPPSELFSCGG